MIDTNKLTKSELMDKYGWTKRMVEKYLPNPEKKYNHWRPTRPVKLYGIADIEAVMQTEEFKLEFGQLEMNRNRKLA